MMASLEEYCSYLPTRSSNASISPVISSSFAYFFSLLLVVELLFSLGVPFRSASGVNNSAEQRSSVCWLYKVLYLTFNSQTETMNLAFTKKLQLQKLLQKISYVKHLRGEFQKNTLSFSVSNLVSIHVIFIR